MRVTRKATDKKNACACM